MAKFTPPPLEKIKEAFLKAFGYVKPKYLSTYVDENDLEYLVGKAYELVCNSIDKWKIDSLDKFWQELANNIYGYILWHKDWYFVSGCEEAIKILTDNGKDCELKNFREIIEEAGVVSYTGDLQEFNLKNLANDLLSSAYALETDEIAKLAKEFFGEAN